MVVSFVFKYIQMLKSTELPEWVWLELKAVADMKFQFQEEEEPIDYVEELASLMQVFELGLLSDSYSLS